MLEDNGIGNELFSSHQVCFIEKTQTNVMLRLKALVK